MIFDGPNGFGKTSFYDAVELLLTGKIRRYRDLATIIVDGRNVFTENPYLNANVPDGDITIKAELIIGGQLVVLSRSCLNADLEHSTGFDKFLLYKHENFEDVNSEHVVDESAFLQPLLGKDYKLNFQFLNYVEQEDNAYLLKNKEAAKKKAIDHLFNVEELQSKLDKITGVRKSIGELCKPQVKKDLKFESDALVVLRREWAGDVPEVPYLQLFSEQSLAWDAERINFEEGIYEFLFGDSGVLVRLKELASKNEVFNAYLFNRRIEALAQNPRWENFLKHSYFLEDRDQLIAAADLYDAVDGLYKEIEEITLEKIESEELNIPERVAEILPEELVSAYHGALEDLEFKLKQATGLKKILAALELSRTTLIRSFENYRRTSIGDEINDCPLCGKEFDVLPDEDPQSLMANITLQTAALREILVSSDNDLSVSVQSFRETEVAALDEQLEIYIRSHPLDVKFIRQIGRQDAEVFQLLTEALIEVEIDASAYFNRIPSSEAKPDMEAFSALFTSKMIPIELGSITTAIYETYLEFFSDSADSFDEFTEEVVDQKIAYIQWQHSLHGNAVIQQREARLALSQQQYDQAKSYFGKLKDLEQAYTAALLGYQKGLIRDIEILFHIYSGRIIQDFQGGLGLFIKEDNGIKFLTDSSKSFDAIFTMSSGQIAALVISFTLALNKKYSKNKLLLIDDPVQTMDELNIAGFVELLRNDFGDRQIFISTHEDKMSAYMRYKFEKFGLRTKRVNMKTAQLN